MPTPSLLLVSLTLFAASVWALAFWRGGAAERWCAGIFAGNQLAFLAFIYVVERGVREHASLIVQLSLDGASAIALLFVLLRFPRPWLGVAMFLCAAQFTLQSIYLVGQIEKNYWHILTNNLNFIAIHLSLVFGTAQHWIRRASRARAGVNGAKRGLNADGANPG
jgi:hypothetical protein